MKGGRHNPLNFEADRRPGDPTAVSDPKCWITGAQAEALKSGITQKIQRLRYAETYQESGVLDISESITADAIGRFQLKK